MSFSIVHVASVSFNATGGRAAHNRANLAEIAGANEQGNGVTVIFESFGISQGQPGKPLVKMPHGQILAFDMAGANPVAPWIACPQSDGHPNERGRGISPLGFHLPFWQLTGARFGGNEGGE